MIDDARAYAIAAHGDQRYGDRPYVHHLDAVAGLLQPYGEQAQVLGYLHDVIEDTPVTVGDLQARFGDLVAACVDLLTDQPGASRKERKARTYARMAEVSGPHELALLVKAADRLANVRACVADGLRAKWQVYRDEHTTFKAAAQRRGLGDAFWAELDQLLATPPALPAS